MVALVLPPLLHITAIALSAYTYILLAQIFLTWMIGFGWLNERKVGKVYRWLCAVTPRWRWHGIYNVCIVLAVEFAHDVVERVLGSLV